MLHNDPNHVQSHAHPLHNYTIVCATTSLPHNSISTPRIKIRPNVPQQSHHFATTTSTLSTSPWHSWWHACPWRLLRPHRPHVPQFGFYFHFNLYIQLQNFQHYEFHIIVHGHDYNVLITLFFGDPCLRLLRVRLRHGFITLWNQDYEFWSKK